MPAALLFDRASAVPPRRGSAGPRKQWDPGLQQFVRTTAQSTDADGRTVPRAGQRSLERSPGPGQYDLSGGENSRTGGLAGSAAFKATASGGCRLSAAYYFYDVCDGKISRCTPQPIVQPDGRVKVKQIRLVDGPGGKRCPRWVLA